MVSGWLSARARVQDRARAVLLALAAIAAGAGASPVRAQTVWEAGFQAIGTAAKRSAAVAGPVVAVRPSSRMRVSLSAGAGASADDLSWRGELLCHFLLSPFRRRGIGLYGAGGVAAVTGPVDRGYLVLTLGAEGRPAARSGWIVEAGVGGGARLAVGYRLRWSHRGP